MSFADVCVNSPAGRRQLFTYSVPPGLIVSPGSGVWVPFGSQTIQGIVLELSSLSVVDGVRPLAGLIEAEPLLSPAQLSLARWLSAYYLCPLFDALALFLPPGFERSSVPCLSLSERASYLDENSLSEECLAAIAQLKAKGSMTIKALAEHLGKAAAARAVSHLINYGYAIKTFDVAPLRIKPKNETLVRLAPERVDAKGLVSTEKKSLTRKSPRRAALLAYLQQVQPPGEVNITKLKEAGFSRGVINALVESGLITFESRQVTRQPSETWGVQPTFPFEPTPAQRQAIEAVNNSIAAASPEVFLLHGVTGSGKTEVYLQALARTLSLGRQGIVLVPEIALTPQTVERFAARFPGKTAVIHSGLSLGERYDTWRDIKKGIYDVVVGARSALFAPLPRLGLIVMDEEHEWTYKQVEQSPRYHTRTVALKLAELSSATVVLGSATPDVESYFQTKAGAYILLELPERLTPRPGTPLPRVEVVDLRAELKSGNRSIFSSSLLADMRQALELGEQVILFFNRRGSSSTFQCRNCGYAATCRRCSVAFSYHSAEESLVCHQCGLRRPVPEKCPACESKRIRFLGLGTQKVVEEAAALFPGARLLRWDSDSARGKGAHREILGKLRRREADILIGTQLVAKGLDLPQVTVVGVVSADTALGLPDFRAGERTFQLLSQVAGRAGRGERPGKVVIQTYAPEHYAVQAASGHDYGAFYRREIEYRRTLGNPPFSRLVRLTFSHANEASCRQEAERVQQRLTGEIAARGIVGETIVGPAPAFIPRLRGRYRWQLIIKGRDPCGVLNDMEFPSGWVTDVDPVGL